MNGNYFNEIKMLSTNTNGPSRIFKDKTLMIQKPRKISLKKMTRQDIFNTYRIGFYTIRDVDVGEELTFDYGEHFSADWNNVSSR